MRPLRALVSGLAMSVSMFMSPSASAGIFDLPSFLDQGKFSVGLEADVAVSNGSGAALNLKPRYGLSDFFNVQGIVGTGTGARRFRLGGVLDLEFFPDVGAQPGIAAPVTLLYTRLEGDGNVTLSVSPLVYKTFTNNGIDYTPFLSVPIGWNARNSLLKGFTQVAVGSLFGAQSINNWKFTAEAGFNIYQSYSYIAGGVTFHFSPVRSFQGSEREAPNTGVVQPGADGTIDPGTPAPGRVAPR